MVGDVACLVSSLWFFRPCFSRLLSYFPPIFPLEVHCARKIGKSVTHTHKNSEKHIHQNREKGAIGPDIAKSTHGTGHCKKGAVGLNILGVLLFCLCFCVCGTPGRQRLGACLGALVEVRALSGLLLFPFGLRAWSCVCAVVVVAVGLAVLRFVCPSC